MKTRRVYFTKKSDVENHSSRGIQGIRVGGRTLFLLEFLPEKFEGKILVEQVEEKNKSFRPSTPKFYWVR